MKDERMKGNRSLVSLILAMMAVSIMLVAAPVLRAQGQGSESPSAPSASLRTGPRIIVGKEIYDEWLGVLEPPGVSAGVILKYAAFVLIPLLVLLASAGLWSWTLRRQVAQRTEELEREIAGHVRAEEDTERIFNLTNYMICVADIDGYFRRINPAWEQTLGYSSQELLNEPFLDFIHPEDKDITMAVIEEKLSQGIEVIRFENRYRCKDGSYKWLSWTSHPIVEQGVTFAIAYDVTERKRAEERVKHLNAVLRAIRSVNQLISREKDRDRLLQSACDNLIETRGYHNAWIALLDESGGLVTSAEAGLGETFLPLLERLERGELTACGQKALAQPGVVATLDPPSACAGCPLAGKYAGRGAMTVRLEYGGKVYGMSSVSIPAHLAVDEEEQTLFREVAGDISFALHSIELEKERKQAEEALRDSEVRFRQLFNNMGSGVAVYEARDDGQDFVFVDFNQAAEQIDNVKRENLIGKSVLDVFLGVKDLGLFDVFQQVWRTGEAKHHPISLYKDERTVSWRENYVYKLPSGNIVAIYDDVTERKRAEEALKEYSEHLEEMVEERTRALQDAQEQLVRREKLAVLGQLAGGVGHELRNPLGVISNAVYYLHMVLSDADETTGEYLGIISSEVRNAGKIVSDLLDLSRARLGEREEVAVSELVAQALEKRPPPEGVQVTTEIASDLPPVYVDPRQIGQVLGNLVKNGYEAMPPLSSPPRPSTPLRTGAGRKQGGRLTINAQVEEGQVALSITDTGCGISQENLEKLFEPLFTTKARGIGLGLAVSRNLVEANGGNIEVESEKGEGSTFTVRLPLAEARDE